MYHQEVLLPEGSTIALIGALVAVLFVVLEYRYRIKLNNLILPDAEKVDRYVHARLEEEGKELYSERKETNKHEPTRSFMLGLLALAPWAAFFILTMIPGILGENLLETILIIVSGSLAVVMTVLMMDLTHMARRRFRDKKLSEEQLEAEMATLIANPPQVGARHRAGK